MDIQAILAVLPHRHPLLLVDRVLTLEPGCRAVALKNVSANEPQFQGHFPGQPLMPGVLILEAMAQVGALLMLCTPAHAGKLALFAGVDACRFRRRVVPGDQLRLEVALLRLRGSFGKVRATASVEGEPAAEAELLFTLTEPAGP
ncbi:MAG: 3-hydroxyacyl-ACP dehydratase FabZ [Candidatus Sericytochromatia bacterium]|nr:3-hydroxyacyl-ACP dehydratase FabZ [Candidatus Sericytochromatia bacterium]